MEINLILALLFLPLLPFIAFLVGRSKLTSSLVLLSGVFEIIIAAYSIYHLWGQVLNKNWDWLSIAEKPFLEFGLWINNYSLALALVVSIVSMAVRVYSSYYLKNERRQSWFLVLIGFFTFAMYGLVLSSNLISIFFFWEWVGLASYLMIGFWYQNPEAAAAARKAFMYNKFGDLGFIMALGIFYFHFGSFNIPDAAEILTASSEQISIWFSIGILIAAFAKSAQLPFSNWLADAMEGPTPASALIHSATMVTAGIYLMIRCFPFLDALLLNLCLYLGAITVLWAGITAVKQNDIKKILAFSTISQLGFMLLGIASGNVQAAFFHLITHAFFKSSLFLSSGILINKQTEFLAINGSDEDPKDIRFMNNFGQKSPFLVLLMILGALALSALPLFSGFLSKEAIIAGLGANRLVLVLALIATFITALYSGRIIFHLLKKSSSESYQTSFLSDLSSNVKYYIPISLLVIFSFSFFYALNPFDFASSWFYKGLTLTESYIQGSVFLLIFTSILSVTGLMLAYIMIFKSQKDIAFGSILDNAFKEGLFIDKILDGSFQIIKTAGTSFVISIESRIIERALSFFTYSFVFSAMILRLIDTYIIDGLVKFVVGIFTFVGESTRQFQGGKIRNYLFWLILFALLGLILIF